MWKKIVRMLGWTRSSYVLMSTFIAALVLIGTIWWPLVEQELALIDWSRPLWTQVDGLLFFDWAVMSLLIMAGADLKADVWIALVSLFGGLAIESWGTQSGLWHYYTLERPPLWILPAWPIAALSWNRLVRGLEWIAARLIPADRNGDMLFRLLYWTILGGFYVLLWIFVWPTIAHPMTILAVLACTLIILSPTDHRRALLSFVAGSSLGYFLERWGTSRLCWTYYTRQTPPLFAVLAHGMTAVAVWRTQHLLNALWQRHKPRRLKPTV